MSTKNTYVAILDVGHGNCTVLRDNESVIIVDCGPGSTLLEFITAEGITQIESIFLSHADKDHIEGIIGLVASKICKIGSIHLNADSSKASALWNDMLYSITKTGPEPKIGISKSSGTFNCGSIQLEVASPSPYLAGKGAGGVDNSGKKITSNSISSSFRVIWDDNVVAYLAGDIDEVSLNDIKDFKYCIEAPLLVFPHHGGNAGGTNIIGFTEELCELVGANTVIFSIGRTKHSNPRADVIKAVRGKIGKLRIACTQMSKSCCTDLTTAPVHLNSFYAHGRKNNHCCSGTFVIELNKSGIVYSPDAGSHDAFIFAAAASPLCKN